MTRDTDAAFSPDLAARVFADLTGRKGKGADDLAEAVLLLSAITPSMLAAWLPELRREAGYEGHGTRIREMLPSPGAVGGSPDRGWWRREANRVREMLS